MARILAIIAALMLSACVGMVDPLTAQCNAATTYGDRYGTPDNRGPCWESTQAVSVMGNIQSFSVRIRGSQYGIAVLTYQGNRLVSATVAY